MKPARFEYCAPATVAQATALLAELREEAAVLAGGMTLGPMLNLRMVRPRAVIDISAIRALGGLEVRPGILVTGATLTQADALACEKIRREVPLLALALPHVGHYQTRSRGTLGGSVAHADPSAEIPLALTVAGGTIVLRTRRRERRVAARDFFLGALTTAKKPDELVVALEWPRASADAGHAFAEIAQRHGDFAICAAACQIRLDAAGHLAHLSLGLGGVDSRPLLLDTARFLGRPPNAALIADLAALAERSAAPMEDHVADAAYRLALARHLIARVVTDAAKDAGARIERSEIRDRDPALRSAQCGLQGRPPTTGRRLAADRRHRVTLTVNGVARAGEAEPRTLLTDFLRHELNLTGVHVGCEHGVCGACTIIRDGRAMRSCTQYAVQADGSAITTVEGLAEAGTLNALQRAFRDHHALQCGFCTPGILMSTTAYLETNPHPTEAEVRDMLSGHICRCTGYQGIVDAILSACSGATQESSKDGAP